LTRRTSALRGVVRGYMGRPRGARRHLAPGLTLDEFFDVLARSSVEYVVLRWFDTLPHVAPGEDIDLLVADQDLELVWSLMAPRPGPRPGQKFDIYSVSGLPGSDYNGIPYYPPAFAREVLDAREWFRNRYCVPNQQHHFDSLAYHAVYHKGYSSGLADRFSGHLKEPIPDHDYAEVLGGLGRALDLPVDPTLDGLDAYLAERGLRPPLDTLERLAPTNRWIEDRFLSERPEVDEVWRGLAVFVLRERAEPSVDAACQELDRQGFEVLEVLKLDPVQQQRVADRLRGGNWARGPWPLSGGLPAVYLIAYDVAPQVDQETGVRANNLRVPRAKERLRARLLADVAVDRTFNPVHSSDNADQALDYLKALDDPGLESRVNASAQRLVDSCSFPYPVVRTFETEARRARVAVVQHPRFGPTVCKMFRPGAVRFWERELRARRELRDLPQVPVLLEWGEHWMLTPLYADTGSHIRRRLPGYEDVQLTASASRALARFAVALHERGLFLLDVSTHNIVTDPQAGLKVLDLEFLQEYGQSAPAISESYTFHGVPAAAAARYDVPQRTGITRRVGGSAFHPSMTGYTVSALLEPPGRLDDLRREGAQLGWYHVLQQRKRYVNYRRLAGASRWGRDIKSLGRLLTREVRRS
jgi:hypothetical protein